MKSEEEKQAEREARENKKAVQHINDLMHEKQSGEVHDAHGKKTVAINLSLVIAAMGFLLVWILVVAYQRSGCCPAMGGGGVSHGDGGTSHEGSAQLWGGPHIPRYKATL